MKKLLLIALISGSTVAASAQQPFGNHSDNDRNHQPAQAQHGFDQKVNRQHDLDNRIAAINGDYNNRINALQHKPFMRTKDRRKQIKQLERERTVALQQCKNSYSRNYGSASRTHRF